MRTLATRTAAGAARPGGWPEFQVTADAPYTIRDASSSVGTRPCGVS